MLHNEKLALDLRYKLKPGFYLSIPQTIYKNSQSVKSLPGNPMPETAI